MKNIGIVGTRRRNTNEDFRAVLNKFKTIYKEGDIIVSGGCPRGGDLFAEMIAKRFNIYIKIFEAEWDKYGKVAGLIRNTDIAKYSEVLIACVAEDRTGGTEDTIKKFLKFRGGENLHLV